MTNICESIFRLLRKNQPTVWNNNCHLAFEKIKEYLLSPLVLVPPMLGRPLLFYLSASDMALRCMLAQLDDLGNERVIYYLSKRILEYEMRCYDGAPFLGTSLGYHEIEALHDRVFSAFDISLRPVEILI